ncbi:MAG: GNAT family N-acetyltransferase [Hyphomicrobiales bacterium]|nr:GNAT family N-acetyltransferase [Hyphomicrobiales bacterium]
MARRGRITSRFTIREYEDRDESQVVELVRELQAYEAPMYKWGKAPEDIGPWYIAESKKWCAKNEGTILVAECDGTLLGYATLLASCEADGTGDEIAYTYAHVADLSVTSSARRQGIGTALLARCEELARGKGRKIFRIGVLSVNQAALAAYVKFGFAPYHQTLEKILE